MLTYPIKRGVVFTIISKDMVDNGKSKAPLKMLSFVYSFSFCFLSWKSVGQNGSVLFFAGLFGSALCCLASLGSSHLVNLPVHFQKKICLHFCYLQPRTLMDMHALNVFVNDLSLFFF